MGKEVSCLISACQIFRDCKISFASNGFHFLYPVCDSCLYLSNKTSVKKSSYFPEIFLFRMLEHLIRKVMNFYFALTIWSLHNPWSVFCRKQFLTTKSWLRQLNFAVCVDFLKLQIRNSKTISAFSSHVWSPPSLTNVLHKTASLDSSDTSTLFLCRNACNI